MFLTNSKKKQTLQEMVIINNNIEYNIDLLPDTNDNSNNSNNLSKVKNKKNKNEISISKNNYKEMYRANVINDQPYGEDFLGYDKYAHALSYVLLSEHIDLPLSVGIFSSWGTGKTFLLKRIEHEIKEQIKRDSNKKVVLVNFNAWEYSGADVLWAGLVKNIYDSTEEKFSQCQTRFFHYFIYFFRNKNKKQIIYLIFLVITIINYIDYNYHISNNR